MYLIEHPPSFVAGTWRVEEAESTLAADLSGGPLEFYDSSNGFWLSCSSSTKHSIKTDSYVILRRKGVVCKDLASILSQINYKAPQFNAYSDCKTVKSCKKSIIHSGWYQPEKQQVK